MQNYSIIMKGPTGTAGGFCYKWEDGSELEKESLEMGFMFQSSLEGNSWHIPQQSQKKKYVCITYPKANMTNFYFEKGNI